MRTLTKLACLSALVLVAACEDSNKGYYDPNGKFIPYTQQTPTPFEHNVTLRERSAHEARNYAYNRRGYYDYNGYYIAPGSGSFVVPANMFPPRGMCRVWFIERDPASQPAVESCEGISARVPAGAYVIYGG